MKRRERRPPSGVGQGANPVASTREFTYSRMSGCSGRVAALGRAPSRALFTHLFRFGSHHLVKVFRGRKICSCPSVAFSSECCGTHERS
jgi:hypothetical protein